MESAVKRHAVRISAVLGEKIPEKAARMSQREALKAIVQKLWPTHTRSHVSREFDLNDHEARTICEGKASVTTIEKVLHHRRGEFAIGVRMLELTIGKDMASAIAAQRQAELEAERIKEDIRQARLSRISDNLSRSFAPGVAALADS